MILKTIRLLNKPDSGKNNGSRPASIKNNDNGEVNRFGISSDDVEHAKKLWKSKGLKLSKFQKSKS